MIHPAIEVNLDEETKKAFVIISDQESYPDLDDIIHALREKEIPYWIDEQSIEKALAEHSTGKPVLAARAVDGKAEIIVARDAMSAELVLSPPLGGNPVSVGEIKQLLTKHGVVFGIDGEEIERAVMEEIYNSTILIASGKEPVEGRDASVEYMFTRETIIHPKEIEFDKVDYRELQTVFSVRKDEVLAQKTPAARGVGGTTVMGKQIPVKSVRDIRLVAGKNTRFSDDGAQVLANIDGQPILRDRTLTVEPVLDIKSDIDFDTGNIDFAGSLIIHGTITAGFSVKATENIDISGVVEDAHVEAGGNVLIKGGIQGGNKGIIRAGGNVSALFVQYGTIEAGRDILIGDVLHSTLSAGDRIFVLTGKGRILGGKVSAQNLIEAKSIGSESNVRTELRVGYKPKEKKRLDDKKKERSEREASLVEVRKGLRVLEQQRRENTLSETKEVLYRKLLSASEELANRIEELREEITDLEKSIEKGAKPEIKVSRVIYANVGIVVGNLSFESRSEITCSALREQEGQIVTSPYVA
ncbi:MAG TPA: FapA family protein [Syntrophorhabdaceae bacterium]|jgi:hypothetical protein